jgi:hypothetical protein
MFLYDLNWRNKNFRAWHACRRRVTKSNFVTLNTYANQIYLGIDGNLITRCTLDIWGHAAGGTVGSSTALKAGRSRV